MDHCPTCGRRHRPRRRATPRPIPQIMSAARQPGTPVPQLVLRADLRSLGGGPRACIAVPGRRLPPALQSIAGAFGALPVMDHDR
jgi:hypothetical protein